MSFIILLQNEEMVASVSTEGTKTSKMVNAATLPKPHIFPMCHACQKVMFHLFSQ